MSAAARFEVLSPLACDGTDYAPGDVVEMPREQAQDLIDAGVLAPAAPDAAPAPAAERLDLEADLPTLIANSHYALGDAIAESHRVLLDAIEALRRDVAARAGAAYLAKDADPSPDSRAGEGESAPMGGDPPPAPEAGGGEPARADLVTRHDRLVTAIAGLTPDRADHWTGAGAPALPALRITAGLDDVTAAERDAAWAAFQALD